MFVHVMVVFGRLKACGTISSNTVENTPTLSDVKATGRRMKLWVSKKGSDIAQQKWRPPKVHRQAVVKTLRNMDTQIRTSTSWPGLSFLKFDSSKPEWNVANWRNWPALSSCQDQGPECVSGMNAMHHFLKLNVMPWWDWSHGCQNDFKNAMKSVGVWPLIILLTVCHNLGHGPERDECLRFHQLNESLRYLFSSFTADDCELFKARAPDMLKQLGSKIDGVEGLSPNQELWEYLKANHSFPKLGHRVRLAQFLGYHEANTRLLVEWTERLFKAELLALEQDWLKGRLVQERASKDVLIAADSETTTKAGVASPDLKLLRGAQQNAAVITVLTLQEQTHLRIVHGITRLVNPVAKWRGECAQQTRCGVDNEEWLVRQISGDFRKHIKEILEVPGMLDFATDCGFLTFQAQSACEQDEKFDQDERLANVFGDMCLQLVSNRIRRCFWAFNDYPHRCLCVLSSSDDDVTKMIAEMKDDWKVFSDLKDRVPTSTDLQGIIQRSSFQLPSTMQFVHGLERNTWTLTPQLHGLARDFSKL